MYLIGLPDDFEQLLRDGFYSFNKFSQIILHNSYVFTIEKYSA